MVLTMVKEQLLVINLLCVITITISAKSLGPVQEYNISNHEQKENEQPTKHKHAEGATNHINKIGTSKTKPETTQNDNDADSMYTDSDLEEAVSREQLRFQHTKDKEPENKDETNGPKDDKQLLDVYTESDLEETVSQDNEKHNVDKRSANSYLYVPKRDLDGFDGSGEGSGDSPTVK